MSAEPDQGRPQSAARSWLLAARLQTLGAAVVPVAVGAAVATVAGGMRMVPTLVALLSAIFIQIGTNFANDVFDFEKGADTEQRLGPTRAVQAGLLTPAQMRRGMVIAFVLAFAGGLYLTWVAGWPMIAIGCASIISGIAYTGGPYPLGYNGLGDVFVFFFFGIVAVAGTAYVSLLTVPDLAWWAAVPPGALATAILVVNNVRDRHTDVSVGKRTLAVRLGRRAALAEYVVLVAAAFAVPVALWAIYDMSLLVLAPLITAPWAVLLCRRLALLEGRALNPVLASTAKLLVVFGLLFAAGLAGSV